MSSLKLTWDQINKKNKNFLFFFNFFYFNKVYLKIKEKKIIHLNIPSDLTTSIRGDEEGNKNYI